jgi:hypothetical protein
MDKTTVLTGTLDIGVPPAQSNSIDFKANACRAEISLLSGPFSWVASLCLSMVRALRHCVCQAAKQDDRGQGVSTLQFALSKKSLQEAIDEGDIFDNPLARDQRSPAPARELEWAGMNTDTDTTNPSSTDPEALEEVVQSNEAVPPEDNDERSADIKESLVTNVQEIDQESSLDQIARMIEFAKVSVQDFGIARLREDAFTQHGENGTAVGAAIKAKITVRKASEQGLQNTEVGNLSTANTMACAFARQILTIDCDEGRVEPTVHHWLWGKQRTLPLPLQTTVGSRRQQRFPVGSRSPIGKISLRAA